MKAYLLIGLLCISSLFGALRAAEVNRPVILGLFEPTYTANWPKLFDAANEAFIEVKTDRLRRAVAAPGEAKNRLVAELRDWETAAKLRKKDGRPLAGVKYVVITQCGDELCLAYYTNTTETFVCYIRSDSGKVVKKDAKDQLVPFNSTATTQILE